MRKEQWVVGGVPCDRRSCAQLITPSYVAFLAKSTTVIIPPQYFVGTAQHESGFATNEMDTEADGYISKGLYQVSDAEAASVGLKGANLYDPAVSTEVFARLQAGRHTAISWRFPGGKPKTPDVWAWLAYAHNRGLGTFEASGKGALGAMFRHKGDWLDFCRTNPSDKIVAYGNDVITGGSRWHEVP